MDILIHGLDEDVADHDVDGQHEEIGAEHLAQFFVPAVTEPARLHVAAKRYLSTVDPAYYATLSQASMQSLALQGGPLSQAEAAEFEQHPSFRMRLSCAVTMKWVKNQECKHPH